MLITFKRLLEIFLIAISIGYQQLRIKSIHPKIEIKSIKEYERIRRSTVKIQISNKKEIIITDSLIED
jgi:hypothetical protein